MIKSDIYGIKKINKYFNLEFSKGHSIITA